MKTELSAGQKELLGIIVTMIDEESLSIDLGLIMMNKRDRFPFVDRKPNNNNNGNKRDQRRNGVIQQIRFLGMKLLAEGVGFERKSKLGRGNPAIYGFKSHGDLVKAKRIVQEGLA